MTVNISIHNLFTLGLQLSVCIGVLVWRVRTSAVRSSGESMKASSTVRPLLGETLHLHSLSVNDLDSHVLNVYWDL